MARGRQALLHSDQVPALNLKARPKRAPDKETKKRQKREIDLDR